MLITAAVRPRGGLAGWPVVLLSSSAAAFSSSLKSFGDLVHPRDLLAPGGGSGGVGETAKFVDCTWYLAPAGQPKPDALAQYKDCRIPGAVYFDIDTVADPSSDLPHMLPSVDQFSEACGSLGLTDEDTVVCYTAPGSFSAARAWWTFKAFGHDRVHILNGGLGGWQAAGGSVESGTPAPPARTDYRAELHPSLVKSWSEVLDISGRVERDARLKILDARGRARFEGKAPEPRPGLEGGHIPNSVCVPFQDLLEEGDVTKFKTAEELRAYFTALGVQEDSEVTTTCGSGVTACVISFALQLAYPDGPDIASVYDGSWAEWGGRADLPKAM